MIVPPNNKRIKVKRKVPFSLEESWNKWTTHNGLLSFFGKDNKTELKLDGKFEIFFLTENPDGLKGSEGCKIISYLPYEMLSFTWNAPPQFPEVRNNDHKAWVVINFKYMEDNITEITLNHLGFLDGEQWDDVYNYFENAWEFVLDSMIKSN